MVKLAVIAGDGVGPEVITHALKVLEHLGRTEGMDLRIEQYDLGAACYRRTKEVLPHSVQRELSGQDAILLGAVGHPDVPPGVLERGLLLKLRFDFQQAINLRPVSLFEGVPTPVRTATPNSVNLLVVRENNEDLYVGAGGVHQEGTAHEVALQTSIHTRAGVERCLRFAFEQARQRTRRRTTPFPGLTAEQREQGKTAHLTLVAKTNVLTHAGRLWMRTRDEIATEYPEIALGYQHVDAACMHMVNHPEWFDVMVTTNMFGDILTDLGAVLQGGMGMAASGNLNVSGTAPSMFEPVHGSAPDIAGQGKANPIAAILSVGLMLDHLGHPSLGDRIRLAVCRALADPSLRTPDLGGSARTEQLGQAVLEALG